MMKLFHNAPQWQQMEKMNPPQWQQRINGPTLQYLTRCVALSFENLLTSSRYTSPNRKISA